ncbi:MAG: hypothetical protein Q7S46_04635 [Gallionella sp.]|nr:hypothetical protein [Gallionella sp.]
MKMRLLSFKRKAFLVLMFAALALPFAGFDAPLSEIWRVFTAIAVVKPAEASDVPLCKVGLASLSKTSGAPGDTFEMHGHWEDTQGAKTAAINMGRGHKLEVLSWTSKVLVVSIPKELRPGAYKVGVYCNNPPHWQGSGFKDFRVTAHAFGDTQKDEVSLPAVESSAPLKVPSGDTALQQNKNAAAPKRGVAHNVPAASPQPQNQVENSAREIVNTVSNTLAGMLDRFGLRVNILIAVGIFALFLLRKFAKPKVDADAPINKKTYLKKPHGGFGVGIVGAKGFEPLSGVYNGVEYVAEELGEVVLGNVFEPTVTVHIEAKTWPIKQPTEINARKKRPVIAHDHRAADINSLLDYGATYIDIGYNTDWVAAEFPSSRVTMDRGFAEHVAECLVRLRNSS